MLTGLGRFLGVLVLCQGLALPALATDNVDCQSPADAEGGEASVSLLLGAVPLLYVARAEVTVGEKTWSTADDAANKLSVGQAFRDGERLLIDLVVPDSLELVAEVRLMEVSEAGIAVTAGTMKVMGLGVWALTCAGP